MKSNVKLIRTLTALCALGFATTTKADYTTDLLAQWTFSSGTAADLTSDVGGYTLNTAGFGTPTYNSGSVSLTDGLELVAPGVNSTAQPALATTATLWVKMQFNSAPTAAQNPAFFFGLEKATAPADWDQSALTGMYAGSVIGQYANTSLGPPTGNYYGALVAPPALNTYFTMALVLHAGFDENGNVNAALTEFQTYLNGVLIGSGSASGTAVDSLSFALGTLKASGGPNTTFDEARVYDAALTEAQISQIGVTPAPEPSASAILISGSFGFIAIQVWFRNRRGKTEPKLS